MVRGGPDSNAPLVPLRDLCSRRCLPPLPGRKATNETLLVDLPSLSTAKLQARGIPPQERVGHAMALVGKGLVYVFGGFVRKLGYMFDVHCLDLSRVEWKQIQAGATGLEPASNLPRSLPQALLETSPC